MLNAVALACPHAVRWEEGVWTHSLCQAHNEHIAFGKLHPHSVGKKKNKKKTFIHIAQVSHSLSEVLSCCGTLLHTPFLFYFVCVCAKYKVSAFTEFVKYVSVCYS